MENEMGTPKEGLPQGEFDALMQSVGGMAPLLGALTRVGGGGEPGGRGARREALLCALKPYLSPARQEAAEYLLRLWRVGDLLRGEGGKGEH